MNRCVCTKCVQYHGGQKSSIECIMIFIIFTAKAMTSFSLWLHKIILCIWAIFSFSFLISQCVWLYLCVYSCLHIWVCARVWIHVCVCVMAPNINIENHPQSLFHLTRWEWLFQQNPKLPDMLVSLASWLWGFPVPTRGYHQQMLTQVLEIHTPLLRCAWKILIHWVISKDMFHMILLYPFTCW